MKSKKINKTSRNTALTKKLTPTQIKKAKQQLTESLKSTFSTDDVMEKLWKEYLPVIETGDVKNLEQGDESTNLYRQAITIYGLDNHFPLSETVPDRYRPLAIEFSRQLNSDYSCRTSLEKALTETIVSAYIRILEYSRKLGGVTESNTFTKDHVALYSVLSKELDRANRHFTTALTTLVQLKSPAPKVNIKTNAAFVAQAQQFNNGEAMEKTINPK